MRGNFIPSIPTAQLLTRAHFPLRYQGSGGELKRHPLAGQPKPHFVATNTLSHGFRDDGAYPSFLFNGNGDVIGVRWLRPELVPAVPSVLKDCIKQLDAWLNTDDPATTSTYEAVSLTLSELKRLQVLHAQGVEEMHRMQCDINSAGDALCDAGFPDPNQPLWSDIIKLAESRDELLAHSIPGDALEETFAVQHNPNCPSTFLVRLPGPGGVLDGKSHILAGDMTRDYCGYGKTFGEAFHNAVAVRTKAKADAKAARAKS